jgi:hypothetical protein
MEIRLRHHPTIGSWDSPPWPEPRTAYCHTTCAIPVYLKVWSSSKRPGFSPKLFRCSPCPCRIDTAFWPPHRCELNHTALAIYVPGNVVMLRIACLYCCALLTATVASAAVPGFPLGIGYSQDLGFLGPNVTSSQATAVATDGSNSPYLLAYTSDTSQLPKAYALGTASKASSFILKESPNGKSIAYLAILGFKAGAMAVDSGGSAYIAGPDFVAKLNIAGTGFVYQFEIGTGLNLASLAVDQLGRLYVAGNTVTGTIQTTPGAFQQTPPNTSYKHTFVLRLNAAGTAIDYATYLAGFDDDIARGIAVDASGSAVVSGTTYSIGFPTTPGAYSTVSDTTFGVAFLARFTPDGAALVYATLLGQNLSSLQVAVDPNGNAAVGVGQFLERFDAAGVLSFSQTVTYPSSVAMDSTGNIYVTGNTVLANHLVKNSLATCGLSAASSAGYLTVLNSNGDLLQSTYLPAVSPIENGLALDPGHRAEARSTCSWIPASSCSPESFA